MTADRDRLAAIVFGMDRRGPHVNRLWSDLDGRQRGPYLRTADALMPEVQALVAKGAAAEIERLAEERAWTTQHDNEVVSVRDLYEQVARLRGELDPVTYDFPPADRADALTADSEAGR